MAFSPQPGRIGDAYYKKRIRAAPAPTRAPTARAVFRWPRLGDFRSLLLFKQLRQLGDVRRNPPRLVFAERCARQLRQLKKIDSGNEQDAPN
jgi:hypothetical protein